MKPPGLAASVTGDCGEVSRPDYTGAHAERADYTGAHTEQSRQEVRTEANLDTWAKHQTAQLGSRVTTPPKDPTGFPDSSQ